MTWLRQWLAAWLSKRERAAPQGATPPPEDCPAFVLCIPDDHPPLDDTPDHPADFGLKTVGDCLNMHKEREEKSAQNFGGKPNNGAGCGAMQWVGKAREGCA